MEEKIKTLLGTIIHPAEGKNIVALDMVSNIKVRDNDVLVILQMKKTRDPFSAKIKKAVEESIGRTFPQYLGKVSVILKDAPAKEIKKQEQTTGTTEIKKIIAISSGKGGVGKSTVTANLAMTLARKGYSVGILDTDIYGPSMPKMFDVEGYSPKFEEENGLDLMIPAVKDGIKIMSIGFFIKPTDALIWRGPMATNTLKQLIHQTRWGAIDYLLIDLPPGTGDIHLTVLAELSIDGAVIVSTPQRIALADVVRGIEMFTNGQMKAPILGMVENMAWFTPADDLDKKYYIFGKDGLKNLAEERNIPLFAQVPLVMSAGDYDDNDALDIRNNTILREAYETIAKQVIANLLVSGKSED